MKKLFLATAAAAALALGCAGPALAQVATVVKDGQNTPVQQNVCTEQRTYGATPMLLPCHVTPDVQGSGTVAAQTLNSALQVPIKDGQASMAFTTHGLAATGATITVQGSNDGGTTWTNINEITPAGATAPGATVSTDDNFRISVAGRTHVQFIVTTPGSSGSPTIAYNLSVGTGPIVEANSKALLNQFGSAGTGITQPTGGSGLFGWMSGVFDRLGKTLTVKQVDSGQTDMSDTVNHALKVNAPLAYNLLNPSVSYNVVANGSGTAYAAGQLLCSSTNAASCSTGLPSFALPLSGGRITGYHIIISDGTTTAWPPNSTIGVKQWSAQPTLSVGDRGNFSTSTGFAVSSGTANWLGDMLCTMNGEEMGGATGYCTPIGPTPELKGVSNVYVAVYSQSGSGATGTGAVTVTLIPSIEQ